MKGWIFHPAIAQCISIRIRCPFQRLALSQTCRAGRKYYWSEPLMRMWRQLAGLQGEETRWEKYISHRNIEHHPNVLLRKNTSIGASILAHVMNHLHDCAHDRPKRTTPWRRRVAREFFRDGHSMMPLIVGVYHREGRYVIEDNGFGDSDDYVGYLNCLSLLRATCSIWGCTCEKYDGFDHYTDQVIDYISSWWISSEACRKLIYVENTKTRSQRWNY